MRRSILLVGALSIGILTGANRANASEVAVCASNALEGQEAMDRKQLTTAREKFVRCAAVSCPEPVRGDCVHWLDAVEKGMPTAVFFADVVGGPDVTDVRVSIDGIEVKNGLDGGSVPIEPGQRRVRFERPGSRALEWTVLFVEGEKNRKIAGHFPAEPSGSTDRRRSALPWIFAGVGVASVASFAGFGLAGAADVRALDRCEPRCASGDVTSARTKYLVADISLGIALVSLGVATYFFLSEGSRHPTRSAGP